MFIKINNWFDKNALKISVVLALFVSVGSFLFFYSHNHSNLVYIDAWAHLNMGRKIFDNLTPGIAQLGGEWLPLLHILMLPTIWIDFMWQSGLSGYLVSGPAFVLSVYFIFKIIELLFEDRKSAFLGALVYMTSINMLYLQTMAMMESLFNLTIIGSIYFIIKWIKKENILDLIIGGIFITLCTLTRYEGYGVFAATTLTILLIVFFKNRKKFKIKSIEGKIILFTTIAAGGISLWTIYLWAIFGDPFHWMHPNNAVSALNSSQKEVIVQHVHSVDYYKNLLKSVAGLWWATANSTGIILLIMATSGLFSSIGYFYKKKQKYLIIATASISLSVGVFLIIGMYFDKVAIHAPILWGENIFNRSLNFFNESGIRYTIALLPFIAIFSSVLSLGKWYKKILFIALLVFQVCTVFVGPFFLTYNFYPRWQMLYGQKTPSIAWFINNYDGGLIFTSALRHEMAMFKHNIPYKMYIHEGTRKYWQESLDSPYKYARWIIMNKDINNTGGMGGSDVLTRTFTQYPIRLFEKFDLVYDDGKIQIFKIKK